MDNTKCKALKAELATRPEPQIVYLEQFFDTAMTVAGSASRSLL
jgi:hypothetical protein